MPTNPFAGSSPGLVGISGNPLADADWTFDADFANVVRYLYVGSAGNVSVIAPNGKAVVYKNVPAGSMLYAGAARVVAATTTVPKTDIIPHE